MEDMIWEVDEDCDGSVNYPEFQAMWGRCREDKSGALVSTTTRRLGGRVGWGGRALHFTNKYTCPLGSPPILSLITTLPCLGTEPRGLYNVVLFLLHDRAGAGRITLEEAMKITYLRVGKASEG